MSMLLSVKPQEKDLNESQLEEITRKYLIGEIRLDQYRAELARLQVRLDLRKIASKIKTGSLEGRLPENMR